MNFKSLNKEEVMLNIYNLKALIEMSVDLISTQPETNLTVSGFYFIIRVN